MPLFSGGPFTITPSVLLEAGIQSGRQPLEVRPISSLLAQFLEKHGQSAIADDTTAFEMQVLHYRRTFVEKMFAIHAKVVRFAEGGDRIGRAARHYADLYVLAGQEDVRTMLGQTEYADIRNDYDEKSRKFFGKSYLPPADLRFNASPALFPDPGVARRTARGLRPRCNRALLRGAVSFVRRGSRAVAGDPKDSVASAKLASAPTCG